MFGIEKQHHNGFDQVILTDRSSQTTVAIVPGCGAMLHTFAVQDGKRSMNIIDSYDSKKSFDEHREPEGFKGLKLSPFPCRIAHGTYRFNNRRYHFDHIPPNEVVMHGLLYKAPFRVVEEETSGAFARIGLLYKYEGGNAGYPFSYDCAVEYRLQEKNTLSITTTVKNTGTSALPVADGWHPYFTFGGRVDDLELCFRSEEMMEFVDLVPTGKILPYKTFASLTRIGETILDNSFVMDFNGEQPMCVLRDPATGWQLEIQPDASYPYLQIYIPPHRQSIAIENLSAPPDSFNNGIGLITLAAGESTVFSTQYVVKKS